jgi:hypothetical protein
MIPYLAMSAFAAPMVNVTIGPETTVNEPLLVRRGVRGAVGIDPTPWLTFEASGAFYPFIESIDITPLERSLEDDLGILPDITALRGDGRLTGTLWPIRRDFPGFQSRIGFRLGLGAVATHDVWQTGGSEFVDEVHSASVLGVVGEATTRNGRLGVRVRFEREAFFERYGVPDDPESYFPNLHAPMFAGADLIVRMGKKS